MTILYCAEALTEQGAYGYFKQLCACTSWEARHAALRLLYGDALVLPPGVRTYELDFNPNAARELGPAMETSGSDDE